MSVGTFATRISRRRAAARSTPYVVRKMPLRPKAPIQRQKHLRRQQDHRKVLCCHCRPAVKQTTQKPHLPFKRFIL